jgi:hypothetical protein
MRHVPQKGMQHVPHVGAFCIVFRLSIIRITRCCGSTPQHLMLLLHCSAFENAAEGRRPRKSAWKSQARRILACVQAPPDAKRALMSLAYRLMCCAQVAGILQGSAEATGRALDSDCIVEPVRGPLIPGFAAVKRAAKAAGMLGTKYALPCRQAASLPRSLCSRLTDVSVHAQRSFMPASLIHSSALRLVAAQAEPLHVIYYMGGNP